MQPGHADTVLVTAGRWTRRRLKVAGRWRYVYRAIDQFGQVIDVLSSLTEGERSQRR
jgi:transposase, IS6 family